MGNLVPNADNLWFRGVTHPPRATPGTHHLHKIDGSCTPSVRAQTLTYVLVSVSTLRMRFGGVGGLIRGSI